MSSLVVDASVVVAWLFDDEDEPRADRALEGLEGEGAVGAATLASGDAQLSAHC